MVPVQTSKTYKPRTVKTSDWYKPRTVQTTDQYKRRTSTNEGPVQTSDQYKRRTKGKNYLIFKDIFLSTATLPKGT